MQVRNNQDTYLLSQERTCVRQPITSWKTTICVAWSASDVKQNDVKVLFATHIMCKWEPRWVICVASTKGALQKLNVRRTTWPIRCKWISLSASHRILVRCKRANCVGPHGPSDADLWPNELQPAVPLNLSFNLNSRRFTLSHSMRLSNSLTLSHSMRLSHLSNSHSLFSMRRFTSQILHSSSLLQPKFSLPHF